MNSAFCYPTGDGIQQGQFKFTKDVFLHSTEFAKHVYYEQYCDDYQQGK